MKNIYLIPTDKPSRLIIQNGNKLILGNEEYSIIENRQHIYITSDEKIKEGDLVLSKLNEVVRFGKKFNPLLYKKITLTTDPKLINDGVQPIEDEFLEWFVKNPSCEYVKVVLNEVSYFIEDNIYRIVIPKEEPKQEITLEEVFNEEKVKGIRELIDKHKQETLEEAAEFKSHHSEEDFIRGGRWQQERMYSEEEVLNITQQLRIKLKSGVLKWQDDFEFDLEEWVEQFKK